MMHRRLAAAFVAAVALSTAAVVAPDSGPDARVRSSNVDLVASSKLAVVILENRDRKRAETEMTYLPALERRFAGATNYRAVGDPSLPNYLAMAFGKTFGITDDRNAKHYRLAGQTIFGSALANGNTAHVYAESMQTPCALVDQGTNGYKVRHTAWPYAKDEVPQCQANMTGFGPLAADEANGLPTLSWIIGNVQHDGHRPSNDRIADAWLRDTVIPPLLASADFQSGALTVVVTFDEGRDTGVDGNVIMFVVLNAALDGAGLKVTTPLTHFDFWRSQLRYGGSTPTGTDALAAFGL